jgi:PhnB protein
MFVQPYVFFDGRCEEALDFYKKALGAEVTALLRYKESPDLQATAMMPPGAQNKVMHCNVRIRDTQIMASDGQNITGQPKFEGFALTLNARDVEDVNMLFTALSDGGQVQLPPTETFFAESFSMLTDKFGVAWMILAEKKQPNI